MSTFLSWWVHQAQLDLVWRRRLGGAGDSIGISIAKVLDLPLNLFPIASQVLEGDSISAFKMRTQLSIVQKSRADMLHAWAMKVGEFGDSNKMFRCLSCLSAACRIEDCMRFLQPPLLHASKLEAVLEDELARQPERAELACPH